MHELQADEIPARFVKIIPDVIYVGDEAIMQLVLDVGFNQEGYEVRLSEEIDWGEIIGTSYQGRGNQTVVEIIFVAYRAGTVVIPPMIVGPHTIRGQSTVISSILPSVTDQPTLFKGLILYPRTLVYGIGLLIALGIIVFATRYGVKFLRTISLVKLYKQLQEWYGMRRKYKVITKLFSVDDQMTLFRSISEFIRFILAKAYHPTLDSATRSELAHSFKSFAMEKEAHDCMQTLLERADKVMYAGEVYTEVELRAVRTELEYFVKKSASMERMVYSRDSIQ